MGGGEEIEDSGQTFLDKWKLCKAMGQSGKREKRKTSASNGRWACYILYLVSRVGRFGATRPGHFLTDSLPLKCSTTEAPRCGPPKHCKVHRWIKIPSTNYVQIQRPQNRSKRNARCQLRGAPLCYSHRPKHFQFRRGRLTSIGHMWSRPRQSSDYSTTSRRDLYRVGP